MKNRILIIIFILFCLSNNILSQNVNPSKSSNQIISSKNKKIADSIAKELSSFCSLEKSVGFEFIKQEFLIQDSVLIKEGILRSNEYVKKLSDLSSKHINFSIKFSAFNEEAIDKDSCLITLLRLSRFNNDIFQDTAKILLITQTENVYIKNVRISNSSFVSPILFWNGTIHIDTIYNRSIFKHQYFIESEIKNSISEYFHDCTYFSDYGNFFNTRFLNDYKKLINGKENRVIDYKSVNFISKPNFTNNFLKNRVFNLSLGVLFATLGSISLYNGSKSYLISSGTDANFWPGASAYLLYGTSSIFMYRSFIQTYERDFILSNPNTNSLIIVKLKF